MSSDSTTSTNLASVLDVTKWVVVTLLLAVAIVGNAYFSDQPFLYRVLGVVGLSVVALVVAAQTIRGRAFVTLLKEARSEIRRVVWPTKQETAQTTGIVVFVVFLMSLLLWLLDMFFGWAISSIIG